MRLDLNKSKKHTVLFALFCLLIVVNPLPLGSNRVWAWSIEAFFATSLLFTLILCSIFSSKCEIKWHQLKSMRLELTLICAWLLVILLYLIPMPLFILKIITPNVAQAYADLGLSYGYMTLDVYASYKMLLLSCYYFIVFILGIALINTRKRIIVVLLIMIGLGVFEAVYGMYLVSIGQTGVLVQVNSVSVLHASGTFINKNHLVAFLSMSFILGLSLRFIISRKLTRYLGISLKERFVRFISQPLRLLDIALFLIAAGIWNTHSRAGLASFVLSLLVFYLLVFLLRKSKTINVRKLFLVFAAVLVVMFFVSNDINYYMETMGQNTQDSGAYLMNSAQGRLLAIEQAFDNMPKYWFSGVGPGAYQVFFVNHRVVEQLAYFDHAHNDYIEFIVEFGLFSLLLLSILMVFFYRVFVFAITAQSQFYKILAISVICAIVYLLLHGTIDFNARIPANVVTIIVAISLVYGKIMKTDHKNP